ncbi:sulfite exporter TauE/SafE family protein [Paracoccus suum]|uniref:Probable membrane transporter protein n=1 Tax=Paracoccus suum TaxID=2259340 RepID=A0A344PKS0_9RHOB|nr:sulfite exporter TauE/SafE family protein [Paracoccus suum]AXC49975.1 sulfite exporter TauE/SafE family protein [Paracoccus suum]
MIAGIDSHALIELTALAAVSGVFGGVLAGLLGVGGGIVIVPTLYFALTLTGMDPALTMQVAVGTSLATIVFTALSSSYGHYRRGALDMALMRRWVPWIVLGVIFGSLVGGYVSGWVLVAVFATIAMIVALDMILRRPHDAAEPRGFSTPVWAILGFLTGAISAMMGIGGGTVGVPILNFLGYDIRRAVGTSAALGFVIGVPGAIIYAATGLGQPGLPPFSLGYVNLFLAAIIIPLSTWFAVYGVRLAHSIDRRRLRMAFGVFLLLTSLRMWIDLMTGAS